MTDTTKGRKKPLSKAAKKKIQEKKQAEKIAHQGPHVIDPEPMKANIRPVRVNLKDY